MDNGWGQIAYFAIYILSLSPTYNDISSMELEQEACPQTCPQKRGQIQAIQNNATRITTPGYRLRTLYREVYSGQNGERVHKWREAKELNTRSIKKIRKVSAPIP